MGSLSRFKLDKIRESFQLITLFETGSFKGDGIHFALKSGFDKIISTEIMDLYFELCTEKFSKNKNVLILKGNSFDLIQSNLNNDYSNTFFWLDAHFPGADGGLLDYNDEKIEDVKYPLQKELEMIISIKNIENDVFLIDDLRMYEDGEYENGNLPNNIVHPKNRNIDFVYDCLGKTHNINKLIEDEGYLLCVPKKVSIYVNDFINVKKKLNKFQKVLRLFKTSFSK